MAKAKSTEVPDAYLTLTVDVSFRVPFKQNDRHNRKAADVLGLDTESLSDDQLVDLYNTKAAELLETSDLTVTNARIS